VADLWLSAAGSRLLAEHEAQLEWIGASHHARIDLDGNVS
jgi:hypothetical protein